MHITTGSYSHVHVLPREIMGVSTFGLSLWLLTHLSIQKVDQILLVLTQLVLGDTARLGIPRPNIGPMELKRVSGKTPVLDVGTIAKIKSGDIKVYPAIQSFQEHGVQFIDGKSESFDVVILATGYKSNVPYWLKEKMDTISNFYSNILWIRVLVYLHLFEHVDAIGKILQVHVKVIGLSFTIVGFFFFLQYIFTLVMGTHII
ncbi:hypothetical protein ACJX0J_015120 [Zea mays]